MDIEEVSVDGKESYVSLGFLNRYKECDDNSPKKKIRLNEIFLLNASLKYCVGVIRKFLFGDLYDWNANLLSYLKELSKNDRFSGSYYFYDLKRDQFIFPSL